MRKIKSGCVALTSARAPDPNSYSLFYAGGSFLFRFFVFSSPLKYCDDVDCVFL